jgi:hypothetical protein
MERNRNEEKRVGVNDRAQDRKDDKRKAAQQRKRRSDTTGKGTGVADWAGVDGDLLARAIAAVSRDGGAIRFGYTRDGGAFAIGFYGDGEPFTEYVTPTEDMSEWLKGVVDDYSK